MQNQDETRLTPIRKNAELVIATLGPDSAIAFGFNRELVAQVERFIENQRGADNVDGLSPVLACFLGEAIIAAAGGAWAEDAEQGLGVRFANGDACFPFAKVAEQFENGREAGDGVLGFYDSSVALATRR